MTGRALLLWLTAFIGFNVYASNAILQVDLTEIEKDQTITAAFTYKGKLDSDPDFSVLENDFTVVSEGLSKSVEIINGNYREQQTWTLTLLSKREGSVVIPAVDFNGELSNPVTLTVSPSKPGSDKDLGDLFLETELTPLNGGYVQQQHMFTVRIYFRGWLIDGQLSDPQVDDQDVVVQSLGEPRRYSVTRNGERYQVYERRHALFPQASGTLSIGETTFSGRLRLPVGGNRLKSVSTPKIERTVKPVPAEFTGSVWLPASSLTLSEIWPGDKLVFEQGVPISRTLTLNAEGLTSAQLPSLELVGSDAVRMYPDQPRSGDQIGENGMLGTRATTVAMVPQQAGDIELPPIEIKWWDIEADQERVARLDAKTLSVLPAAGAVEATTSSANVVSEQPITFEKNPWFYATLLCGSGWLLTFLMRRRPQTVDHSESVRTNSTSLRTRLKNACHRNDAKACAHVLGELLKDDHGVGRHQRLLSDSRADDLRREWQNLNRYLYGQNDAQQIWSGGKALFSAYEKIETQVDTTKPQSNELAPLAPTV